MVLARRSPLLRLAPAPSAATRSSRSSQVSREERARRSLPVSGGDGFTTAPTRVLPPPPPPPPLSPPLHLPPPVSIPPSVFLSRSLALSVIAHTHTPTPIRIFFCPPPPPLTHSPSLALFLLNPGPVRISVASRRPPFIARATFPCLRAALGAGFVDELSKTRRRGRQDRPSPSSQVPDRRPRRLA